VLENEEQSKDASRKIEIKYSARKTMATYISELYYKKLPVFRGHDSVLVVCDRFSKMLHFIMTTEKIIIEELARLFRDNI